MRHIFGGILAGSLLLFACGGDDDSAGSRGTSNARTDAYVEAVAASMNDNPDEPQLDEAQATCLATAIVGVVGIDRLEEAGITPQQLGETNSFADLDVELPDGASGTLADDIADCGLAGKLADVLAAEFGSDAGSELPDEAVSCLREAIDDQAAGQALATTFVEDDDQAIQNLTVEALRQCPAVMTALVLAQASGTVTSEDAACAQSVVEDNRDLVETAILEQDAEAGDELGALMVSSCPGLASAFAGS